MCCGLQASEVVEQLADCFATDHLEDETPAGGLLTRDADDFLDPITCDTISDPVLCRSASIWAQTARVLRR